MYFFFILLGCSILQFAWSLAVIAVSASRCLAGESRSFSLGSQRGLQPDLLRAFDLDHSIAVHHDLHDSKIQRVDLATDYLKPGLNLLTTQTVCSCCAHSFPN